MNTTHRSTLALVTALGMLQCGCGGNDADPLEATALAQAPDERRMSRLAAEQIDEQSGGRVIWIDAGCCAGLDPRLPESIVSGLQAVMGTNAPVFVHGADAVGAQQLIGRLDQLGEGRRAYLVMP